MKVITQLFPLNAAGTDFRAGILMLPDDYLTNPEKCPLVVFSHGSGEFANAYASIADVNKLYLNGSPLYQAQSGLLNTVTCPVTGKVSRPAVFALQGLSDGKGGGWCVPAAQAIAGIKLMLTKYPMVDTTRILATGLSAGGEVSFEMLGSPDAGMFAAGFPLSCAPSVSPSLVNWTGPIGRVWAMHGNTDTGTITDKSNSSKAVDAINGAKAGYAYYSEFSGGHCCWASEYIPSFRKILPVTANGTPVAKAINAYEFWMMCRNTKVQFTASGTAGGTNPTNMSALAKAKVTYDAAKKEFTLDGTGTTGSVGSFKWAYTGPAGSNPWWADGRADGGAPITAKTLQNIAPGVWKFTLTVVDTLNVSTTDTVSFDTAGTVTPPVPVPPAPPVVPIGVTGANVEVLPGGNALKVTVTRTDTAGNKTTEVIQ